jgi:hypothetical protein
MPALLSSIVSKSVPCAFGGVVSGMGCGTVAAHALLWTVKARDTKGRRIGPLGLLPGPNTLPFAYKPA